VGLKGAVDPPNSVADQRCSELAEPRNHGHVFPLVRGGLVGLPGLEPGTSSSGEDLCPRWQTAWYLPRSTRTWPSPRSSQRPRGRLVLPIFIRQGWPQAMSHLSAITRSPPCRPASSQLASDRQGRSNALWRCAVIRLTCQYRRARRRTSRFRSLATLGSDWNPGPTRLALQYIPARD
jgi:hypothetical protein